VLTVGSLFAGIGGFDLGFERAGMRTLWFCEQDAYCQRVLARHWPGVPCHPDVRALVADTDARGCNQPLTPALAQQDGEAFGGRPLDDGATASDPPSRNGRALPVSVPYVDVLCGGFPCQDISLAGKGAGIDGSRSGLWQEFARLIGELRPRYVVVENVPALTSRGLDRVLADLAACGFDAEWDHLPASAFGAPHRRDRIWIVAYPYAASGRLKECSQFDRQAGPHSTNGDSCGRHVDRLRDEVADAKEERRERPRASRRGRPRPPDGSGRAREVEGSNGHQPQESEPAGHGDWAIEPDVGRVADGVSARVDRLRSLGNALVPQIAQWIGERIVSYERCWGRRS
jgi:DNA (cytosine-5)-methyltransferase 1